MKVLLLLALFSLSAVADDVAKKETEFVEVDASNCKVSRTGEHYAYNNRCYSQDEVMVGAGPDASLIRCARLVVTCARATKEDQTPTSPEKADPIQ